MLNPKKWMTDVMNALIPAKTTFTPTTGSSYSSYGGCYYEKMGRLVHIHLGLSGLTANTRHTVYNLQQSLRPSTAIFAVGQTDSASSTCNLIVNSSGSVTVLSQSTYCSADVIFMI